MVNWLKYFFCLKAILTFSINGVYSSQKNFHWSILKSHTEYDIFTDIVLSKITTNGKMLKSGIENRDTNTKKQWFKVKSRQAVVMEELWLWEKCLKLALKLQNPFSVLLIQIRCESCNLSRFQTFRELSRPMTKLIKTKRIHIIF